MKEELVEDKEEQLLITFKESILNVKLDIFRLIEENPMGFRKFKEQIQTEIDTLSNGDKELEAKLLSLSFYLFEHTKDKDIDNIETINQSLKEAKELIESDFMDTLLPTKDELLILDNKGFKFKHGLEYEFWLKEEYYKLDDSNQKKNLNKILKLMDKLDLIPLKEEEPTKEEIESGNIKEQYKKNKIYKPKIENEKAEQHYFEIFTKKFNSMSEMLIFNNLILNSMNSIKIENKSGVNVRTRYDIEQTKSDIYKIYPGSIHFNISLEDIIDKNGTVIKDIKDINKVLFFTYLEENGIIEKWGEERNKHVKDLRKLTDIFGPFVLDSEFKKVNKDGVIDRSWNINFEHLIDSNDKKRIEIRFIGGDKYNERISDINNTILEVLNAVKVGMGYTVDKDGYRTKKEIDDKYIKLLNKDNLLNMTDTNIEKLDEIFGNNKGIDKYIQIQNELNIYKKQKINLGM